MHVTAINCGNMDFTIGSMGFVAKDNKLIIKMHSPNQYPFRLKNGEQTWILSEMFWTVIDSGVVTVTDVLYGASDINKRLKKWYKW